MNETSGGPRGGRAGNAFLLAQVGAHATARFAQRVGALDLTPAHAGLLRLIARQPGQSQQVLAQQLRTPASRLVHLVDALEGSGLIERRRNPGDRRNYALYLTGEGSRFMRDGLGRVAAAHEDDICSALSASERAVLNDLLSRIARQQGLVPGIHPGYRGGHPGEQETPESAIDAGTA
jgi:DNA-binding MarR family transcriptional regulator